MQKNSYIKLSATCTEGLIGFLTQSLEFEVIDKDFIANKLKGALLRNTYGDVLLVIKQNDAVQAKQPVIINTADCLRSCFQLSASGVKVIEQPYYTSEGLAATISDQFGNNYLLIEKRSLIEN